MGTSMRCSAIKVLTAWGAVRKASVRSICMATLCSALSICLRSPAMAALRLLATFSAASRARAS